MKHSHQNMAEFFKALGDPTRLKIFRMLTADPERSLCVGAIAERLGIAQPTVSQHLKVLKNVDLVEPNRNGFRIHYTVNLQALDLYRDDIEELCKAAAEVKPCHDDCHKQSS